MITMPDQERIDKQAYAAGTDYQFETPELSLGPWTSYSMLHDPRHMCFVLSRYKFVAKMLEGKAAVMEVGCGDGFGIPIVAQTVGQLYALDWDARLLEGNARRLHWLKNVGYLHVDLNVEAPAQKVDAAFSVDVIEHLEPRLEAAFMENTIRALKPSGVLITGTPNVTASQYASPRSEVQHINLKSMKTLRELTDRYFENVFMFAMNDEVVHTGYAPMCQYIWSMGVGVRPEWQARQ